MGLGADTYLRKEGDNSDELVRFLLSRRPWQRETIAAGVKDNWSDLGPPAARNALAVAPAALQFPPMAAVLTSTPLVHPDEGSSFRERFLDALGW